MVKETKIVQVKVTDASPEDVEAMVKAFSTISDKLPYDIEFIVTNEKLDIHDIAHLINELYDLYKKSKEDKK